MTRYLCHECRKDLTSLFLEKFGDAIKIVYPQIRRAVEDMEASGAMNVTAEIKRVGGVITCPKCDTINDITLDSLEQWEEMVREVNR